MNAAIDPDEGPRAVLARLAALRADPPPPEPTLDGLVTALCSRWCLKIPVSVADFPRRYGRKVKAAGGSYSECRGHSPRRFVQLPHTSVALADAMLAEACAPFERSDGTLKHPRVTVVAEGYTDPFDFGNARSWIVVHDVRSMAEAVEAVRRAVSEALARGYVDRRTW